MPHATKFQQTLGAVSCFKWGKRYEAGNFVVSANMQKALNWYKAAAELGSADAQIRLGAYYKEEKNFIEAKQFYETAAKQKRADGYVGLAEVFEAQKKYHDALKAYKAAGLLGDLHGVESTIRRYISDKEHGAQALFHLGELEENKQEWKRACDLYQRSANCESKAQKHQYSVYALVKLGQFYYAGRPINWYGVQIVQDIVEAIKYFKQAAVLGSGEALNELLILAETNGHASYALGECYGEGASSMSRDTEAVRNARLGKMLQYFQQSYRQGLPAAKIKLAEIAMKYQQDEKTACRYYVEAAEQGDKGAQNKLPEILGKNPDIDLYLRLAKLIEQQKDLKSALGWYFKAYELNKEKAERELMRLAQANVSYAFDIGGLFGVNNPAVAMDYYFVSASMGHAQALSAAEILAKTGFGDLKYKFAMGYYQYTKDTKGYVQWLMRAYTQGYKQSLDMLKAIVFDIRIYLYIAEQFNNGGLVERDDVLALYFYQKLADKQHAQSIFKVGEFHEQGRGTNVNLSKACSLYLIAAKSKCHESVEALERLAAQQQVDALYELGNYQFEHSRLNEGLLYYAAASQRNHAKATEILLKKHFTQDQLLLLATSFDKGHAQYSIASDRKTAICYCRAASLQGSASATYWLGEYAEDALNELGDPVDYFIQALHQKNTNALKRLEIFGKEKNGKACYALSQHYTCQHGMGVAWLLSAADAGHVKANHDLRQGKIDKKYSYFSAHALETGEMYLGNIKPQLLLAFLYYKQVPTDDPHYGDALSRLVKFYHEGLGGVSVDNEKAAETYLEISSKETGEVGQEALMQASKLIESMRNWELYHKLGQVYQHREEWTKAIYAHKKAADNDYPLALSELNRIAQVDPEHAHFIGNLYIEDNVDRALDFFQHALMLEHEDTVDKVNKMATTNPAAMYAMACHYFVPHAKIREAIDMLMRAVVYQHPIAMQYLKTMTLTTAECNSIAAIYEKGEGIHKKNFEYAIAFRIKALNKKAPNELMHLAALCEHNNETPKESRAYAWEYYFKAAELNNNDALLALERIAQFEVEDKQNGIDKLKQIKSSAVTQVVSWRQTLPKRKDIVDKFSVRK